MLASSILVFWAIDSAVLAAKMLMTLINSAKSSFLSPRWVDGQDIDILMRDQC